ncbi:hypothetical protein CRUP_028541, partial [Coryphaenoides rupestris]
NEDKEALPSGDEVDEGWLLLNNKEAVSEECSGEEDQGSVELPGTVSTATVSGHSDPNLRDDSRPSEPEVPVLDHSAPTAGALLSSTFRQAAALAKITQASHAQRAQAETQRRRLTRSAIRRQNCVRMQSQNHGRHAHSSTYLHQPARRINGAH